jgi:hypothetical protein
MEVSENHRCRLADVEAAGFRRTHCIVSTIARPTGSLRRVRLAWRTFTIAATALAVAPNRRLTQYRTRFEERIRAEFASAARSPEAAEWGERFMRRAIDDDAPGLQLSGRLLGAIDVGR